jgi:UDP-N-acetylmuramoyl-tripeptide--D-alanyl-D-alanine ligase
MQLMTDKIHRLFSIGEIGEILGSYSEGDPGFRHFAIYNISTDSRTIKESELFVALIGEKHNGHDHIDAAFVRGAAAAVVSKAEAQKRGLNGSKYFPVDDTLFAFGELARRYRAKMPARITAVTGSNGKTTVKNLIYEIFSRLGPALKSEGNFNNLIGLPASIFGLREEHQNAVLELGMSARGEISRLSEIASPDLAIITNVGPVHLEYLKSIDAVAEAKLEIVEHLRKLAPLVINGDDEMLSLKLGKINHQVIRFGLNRENDISPRDLEFDDQQLAGFRVANHIFELKLPGIHNVYNALAAYAAAHALGIDTALAVDAINSFRPQAMRSEVVQAGGVTLLIDCYNANPASTRYALETLSRIRSSGRRIAVLGDMLELGQESRIFHEEIGKLARTLKIDNIFGFGPNSKFTVANFGDGGFYFGEKEGLIKQLREMLGDGDVVLFKGSRAMVLEEVVDAIKNTMNDAI